MTKSVKTKKPNDAIPSWSGFNYQGKMTLLCLMELLNDLLRKKQHPEEYYVELEKEEDFVFYQESNPISLFQVKAHLGHHRYSHYSPACKKLLEHKSKLNEPSAKCFLITAEPIISWDDPSNIYETTVNLYLYKGKCVGLMQVKSAIIALIEEYMNIDGRYTGTYHTDYIYQALCMMLDEQVSKIHKFKDKAEYKIPFKAIQSCILEAVKNDTEIVMAVHKELVYEHISSVIYRALEDFCNRCPNGCSLQDCLNPCGAREHYEKLSGMNLWGLIEILNPDCLEWTTLNYVSHVRQDEYKELLFEVFSHCNTDQIFCEETYSYLENDFMSSLPQDKIIPTLMSVSGRRSNIASNMQTKLKHINQNEKILPQIEGRILTANTGGYECSLRQGKVTNMPSETNCDNKKATDVNLDTVIIDIEMLIEKMEGN